LKIKEKYNHLRANKMEQIDLGEFLLPLPITHLFITVLGFDLLRDAVKSVRIRNRDLAVLGVFGILPDIDVLLVPFLGWNIHKRWTHSFLSLAVFAAIILGLALLVAKRRDNRILFGLGILAFALHIGLDFLFRSVPLIYPWAETLYGFALLGSPLEYLRFSMLDSTIFGLFFLYYLITGFTTFRYAMDYPAPSLWFNDDFEDGTSTQLKGWIGFFRKKTLAWRIHIRILPPADSGSRAGIPRAQIEFWSIDDPHELLYASTFYTGFGELARDAGLFIRVASITYSTENKTSYAKIELLPAQFTSLIEIIQRLTRQKFFEIIKVQS
jgi:membrane-bound metal-dependent hydrolase YbcI (DUF457 family)